MKALKRALYALAVGFVLWVFFIIAAVFTIAEAGADVTCEFRTASHSVEHGGVKADSAWHVAHGDLPTCVPEDTDRNNRNRDHWGRDEVGFHCTWRGCG